MNDKLMIQTLIGNIREDVAMLEAVEQQLEPLQEQKRGITARLKEQERDAGVLIKYADDQELEQLEKLGFVIPSSVSGLNEVSRMALEAVIKSKDKKLTNDALYKAYEKACKDDGEDPLGYADFNIKCRPLFNSQKLVRTKGKDPNSSRDDMISLNGYGDKATEEKPSKK